jgi:hypothetical protein
VYLYLSTNESLFLEQHLECFVGWQDPDKFFSQADRARMVHDLLIRARYDRGNNMDKLRFGIDRLVRNNTYSAAYPLHEVVLANTIFAKKT